MFSDREGNSYFTDKITRIGPSKQRPDRQGLAVYEHQVWLNGADDPVWVDCCVIDELMDLEGQKIGCGPGFYVVNFRDGEAQPELIPIIGWIVSSRCERPKPITLNGSNNGQPGAEWPILDPTGAVDDWDRSFSSLEGCVAGRVKDTESA